MYLTNPNFRKNEIIKKDKTHDETILKKKN